MSEVLSQITSRKLFKLEWCSPKTRVVVSPLQLAKDSPIACGASAKKPTLIQAFPKPRAEGLPSIRQLARNTSKSCDTSASRPRSIQTGPKQGCLDSAPICSWSGPPQYSAILQRSSWLDSAHSGGSRPRRIEVVRYLCEQGKIGANRPNNKDGLTPIEATVHQSHCEVVRYLCEQVKVDANKPKDKDRWTPLIPAGGQGHLEVVRYLCEQAKVDATKPRSMQSSSTIILVGLRSIYGSWLEAA